VSSSIDLDVATARFEATLEKRLTEITSLKSELQSCKNALASAQRQAQFAADDKVFKQLQKSPETFVSA
jgi:hypothetical protein